MRLACQRLSKKHRKVLELKRKCGSQGLNAEQKELLAKLPHIEYALLEAETFLKMVEHVAEEQNATVSSSNQQQPLAEETETQNSKVSVSGLSSSPVPSIEDQGISKVHAECQAVPVMNNKYTSTYKKRSKGIGTNPVQLQTAEGSNNPRDYVHKALHKLLSMLQQAIRCGLQSSSTTMQLCEKILARSFSLTPETKMLSSSQSMKRLEMGVSAALDYIFFDSPKSEVVSIGKGRGEQEEKTHDTTKDFVNMTISRDEVVVDQQAQQVSENGGEMKADEKEMRVQKRIGLTSTTAAEAILKGVMSGSGVGHIWGGGELAAGKIENVASTPTTSDSVISADSTPPVLPLALESLPPVPSPYIMPNVNLLQPHRMDRWPENMKLKHHHNIKSSSSDELMSIPSQHFHPNIQDPSHHAHLQGETLTQTQPLPPPPGLSSGSQVGEVRNSSTDPQHPPDWFHLLYKDLPQPPEHWAKDMSSLSLEEPVIKGDDIMEEEEEYDPMRTTLSTRKQKSGRYNGNKKGKKCSPRADAAGDDNRCGDVKQQRSQQPHVVQKSFKQQQWQGKVSSTAPQEVLNAKALSSRGSRKNATAVDSDCNEGSKQSKTILANRCPLSSNSDFGVGSTGKVEAQRNTIRGKPDRKREKKTPR